MWEFAGEILSDAPVRKICFVPESQAFDRYDSIPTSEASSDQLYFFPQINPSPAQDSGYLTIAQP
jgi:hypothetical protein